MTESERQAYIDSIVSAAPPLSAEDAALVRAWIPLRSRRAAEAMAAKSRSGRRRSAA
ncbi:hypothetical protein AB0F46_01860 [Streptomyces sp. NPDC026665]|uniref:hypothetical protein n=1 Tax=Streptomyces sp. NPDC026665 TaxID=3154798 RepID=UPI0033D7BFD3